MQQVVNVSEGGVPTGSTGATVVTPTIVTTARPVQVIPGGGDLGQIYPSKTNNLNYVNYQDILNQDLFCSCIQLPFTKIIDVLRVGLCLIILFLFLAFVVLFGEIISYGYFWYFIYSSMYFMMIFALIATKGYILYQSNCYIKYSRINSLDYHQYGMKLYYGLYADLPISFLLSMIWLFVIGHLCLSGSNSCERYTSFDNVVLGVLTWLLSFPLFVWSIFGMVMLIKLPKYFEQFAYRNYAISQDKKYCLFYHYNVSYPPKQACICCGQCCQPGSCDCCIGCETLPKCGLKAISIWTIISALGGLYMIIIGLNWMAWSFYSGFLMFFYGVALTYLHFAAGIYGTKLANYQNSLDFHKYTHLAMTHFLALGGIYFVLFVFVAWYQLLIAFLLTIYFGVAQLLIITILVVIVEGFISYLPWEAVKLIDSNAKWETCTKRHLPNAINMDLVVVNGGNVGGNVAGNVQDGNGVTGVTGAGVSTGVVVAGGGMVAMAPVNPAVNPQAKPVSNITNGVQRVQSEENLVDTMQDMVNV